MPVPQAMPAPMPAPMAAPQAKAPPVPPPKMPAPPPKPAAPSAEANNEDSHFRDVYAQYVDTRKQCGESVAELTFDKFVVTLRKNRDQILNSRADAQGVRFSVYVKDGKAALKAVPTKA